MPGLSMRPLRCGFFDRVPGNRNLCRPGLLLICESILNMLTTCKPPMELPKAGCFAKNAQRLPALLVALNEAVLAFGAGR